MRRNDQLVPPATERLAAYKRAAIPQIETSLHTSAPTGRLHLIAGGPPTTSDDEKRALLSAVLEAVGGQPFTGATTPTAPAAPG